VKAGRRFTDTEIKKFHRDFRVLVKRVGEMEDRLENHMQEVSEYRKKEDDRWDLVLEVTKANTEAIEKQAKATSDLVKAWRDWIGTKRVLQGIGKFMVWLGSFSVIGSIIYWLSEGK
jgi:hypothetical protein